MKCENCRREIEDPRYYVDELRVCRPCCRALQDLTRETGGEIETVAEIRYEQWIDSIVGVYG